MVFFLLRNRIILLLMLMLIPGYMAFSWTFWTPGDTVDNSAQYGFVNGYKPDQPIPFNHQLHAEKRKMECAYCHSAARRSTSAGLPPSNTCMGCHSIVNTDAEPIKKLKAMYDKNQPIEWVRVHDLPDYARFSHKVHVLAKDSKGQNMLECQTCHGPVEKGGVAEQWAPLQMGWCIDCHNKERIPATKTQPAVKYARVSCATCHY